MIENNTQITEIFDLLEKPSQTDLPGRRSNSQRGQIKKDNQGRSFFNRAVGYNAHCVMTVVPDLLSVSNLIKSDYLVLLGLVSQIDNKDEIITSLNPKFISTSCFEFTAYSDGDTHTRLQSRVELWPEDEGVLGRLNAAHRSVPWDFSKEYLLFFLIIFINHYNGLVKLYQSEIRPDEFGSPDTTSWQ